VLTGFTFHGPDGQVLADHDFGTVSVVGREPLVLDYQIADDAVYSDGKPITCDDMVLAWAAQSGRFPASTPPARRAIWTSPASTVSPARRRLGSAISPTARSSTTCSCSPPRR
jgi:ABC-type transport system substrate-binding protein